METQLFTDAAGRDLRWQRFMNKELGLLWQSIPFDELASLFPSSSGLGAPGFFDVKGGIALQILKSYLNGMSDDKLREQINTNWAFQYFCGIRLGEGEEIKDKDIVGRWRRWLAKHMDYDAFQLQLAAHWKPFMKQTSAVLADATCYESHLRYPTDVKLLWECIEWLWRMIDRQTSLHDQPKVRRKQKEVRQRYLAYQKLKRKPRGRRKSITRSLLYLLNKGLTTWINLLSNPAYQIILLKKEYKCLENIRLVHEQQKLRFSDPEAKIENRIVSLFKPYIRPIIRGKEIKRTEFGAKVHAFVVDGITFVERFSYDAFNEGIRLEATVKLHQEYFENCKYVGADKIYANNANRKFCAVHNILTSFAPKGPKPKKPTEKMRVRRILASARASHMEGTFGTEKLYYGLNRINARTEATEKLWIHFGIWTASAMRISRRIKKHKEPPKLQLAA